MCVLGQVLSRCGQSRPRSEPGSFRSFKLLPLGLSEGTCVLGDVSVDCSMVSAAGVMMA